MAPERLAARPVNATLTFMKAWVNALAEDDRRVADWLLSHGCEFVWRDGLEGEAGAEPFVSGTCWFEIWRGPELLTFLGPFAWPMPDDRVRASGRFVFRQVRTLLHHR